MRLLGSLALFCGWRSSMLLPIRGCRCCRRCCCRLEVVGAVAGVIGSVLCWASLCSVTSHWPAGAVLESRLILSSELSIEGPVRIREEYFEGLLEPPIVIEEAVPTQLRSVLGQAVGTIEQLPLPLMDVMFDFCDCEVICIEVSHLHPFDQGLAFLLFVVISEFTEKYVQKFSETQGTQSTQATFDGSTPSTPSELSYDEQMQIWIDANGLTKRGRLCGFGPEGDIYTNSQGPCYIQNHGKAYTNTFATLVDKNKRQKIELDSQKEVLDDVQAKLTLEQAKSKKQTKKVQKYAKATQDI
ncbi:hypothetical protein Cgig2_010405 [Carnegiea gigantea]|uniref:Uncharacterized protein n=1 Tax=Carnegiea gigantea TaxID=171969 RepID=A0A9Q1JRJ0_9CARY|nr:hypothetical protein Cgig2_010405 [Carnegiea gigantea]